MIRGIGVALKQYLFDCGQIVLLTEMTVDTHCKRSAVFVTQPTTDRWNVDARFDACSGKEMPEVMMREMRVV